MQAGSRVLTPRSKTSTGFNRALSYTPLENIQKFLIDNGFTDKADWPEGWARGVALSDAAAFSAVSLKNTEWSGQASLAEADEAVTLLMGEVVTHFKMLRQTRFREEILSSMQAMKAGRYSDAEASGKRALRQYADSKQAERVIAKAQMKLRTTNSFLGHFMDRIMRAYAVLFGAKISEEIEMPKGSDL